MKTKKLFLLLMSLALFGLMLAGCSSSDTSTQRGQFIDGAVVNINYYSSGGASGDTDSDGYFIYIAGKSVIFYIGQFYSVSILKFPGVVPSASKNHIVTLLDLFDATSIKNKKVLNACRLLMAIDSDGDPSNGIQIDDSLNELAPSDIGGEVIDETDFDQEWNDFEDDAVIDAFVIKVGLKLNQDIKTRFLNITMSEVILHLSEALSGLGVDINPVVGAWYKAADSSGSYTATSNVLTLLADNSYMYVDNSSSYTSTDCPYGIEQGTYTWSSASAGSSGKIELTDANGYDCGLKDKKLMLNTTHGRLHDSGTSYFYPVLSTSDLYGSWYESDAVGLSVVALIPPAGSYTGTTADITGGVYVYGSSETDCMGMQRGGFSFDGIDALTFAATPCKTTMASASCMPYSATFDSTAGTLNDDSGAAGLVKVE